jgi:hypothetical protein
MQIWLDREAERKRIEEEKRLERERLQRIADAQGKVFDSVAAAGNADRIRQNLGRFNQARPESVDGVAELEAKIKASPSGYYDPITKRFYEGGEEEARAAQRVFGIEEANKKFGKDEEAARLMVSEEARRSRDAAVALMDQMGLTEQEKSSILASGDATQAAKAIRDAKLSATMGRGVDARSFDDLASKVSDSLKANMKIGTDGGATYARQMYQQRGMAVADAQKRLEEQLATERGSEYGQMETARAERQALIAGLGELARLDPQFKISESAAERLLKETDERLLKLDTQRDKREAQKDLIRGRNVDTAVVQYGNAMKQVMSLEEQKRELQDKMALAGLNNAAKKRLQDSINETDIKIQRLRNTASGYAAAMRYAGVQSSTLGLIAASKDDSPYAAKLQDAVQRAGFSAEDWMKINEEFARGALPGYAYGDIQTTTQDVTQPLSLSDEITNLGREAVGAEAKKAPTKKVKRSATEVKDAPGGTGGGGGGNKKTKKSAIDKLLEKYGG